MMRVLGADSSSFSLRITPPRSPIGPSPSTMTVPALSRAACASTQFSECSSIASTVRCTFSPQCLHVAHRFDSFSCFWAARNLVDGGTSAPSPTPSTASMLSVLGSAVLGLNVTPPSLPLLGLFFIPPGPSFTSTPTGCAFVAVFASTTDALPGGGGGGGASSILPLSSAKSSAAMASRVCWAIASLFDDLRVVGVSSIASTWSTGVSFSFVSILAAAMLLIDDAAISSSFSSPLSSSRFKPVSVTRVTSAIPSMSTSVSLPSSAALLLTKLFDDTSFSPSPSSSLPSSIVSWA
mmetsp:Transcript_53272/g.147629  ORF Transcript_53272/g.147629 Transcript_53272/m.147629 type:complete len:294 (-) Transcript_53272:70-951(-)